eukprot:1257443-Amphidinium_carterae.2
MIELNGHLHYDVDTGQHRPLVFEGLVLAQSHTYVQFGTIIHKQTRACAQSSVSRHNIYPKVTQVILKQVGPITCSSTFTHGPYSFGLWI